ncbi:MAG: translation initiation factor IF-2 [Clostridiales bacterium]|nr:translation initiation factor IF-2 [Clostridiales bacterium]
MAKKYENVEKVLGLLDDKQLGGLQKRLSSTEKNLSEILKKLSVLETAKAERDVAEAAARAAEEAAKAVEEAEKAAKAEVPEVKEEPIAAVEEQVEETPKKKTTRKKAEETPAAEAETPEIKEEPKAEEPKAPVEVETVKETPKVEEPTAPVATETVKEEPKADARTFVPKTEARPTTPAAPRAPRYFRNGQEQGVYVAKPGVETTPSSNSTFRPRPQGDRPARPQGDRPFNNARPANGGANNAQRPARPVSSGAAMAAPITPTRDSKSFSAPAKKKTFEKTYTEKKPLSKRTLIKQQGMTVEDFDEDKSGYRKVRSPKKQKRQEIPTIKIEHAVVTTQEIPLKVLSEKLGVSAVEITKRLFKEGIMKGINDSIDYDNAALMAADMGIDLEYKPEKTAEEVLMDTTAVEDESKLITRAPVVTVMGHVDHGKTSLLDAIRSTSVTSGEAGGITQSIGAYTVTAKGKQITFIDTPGHAAFTAMRARGAQVTDVVILVVAADDGIMPQTIEAINHAKAANVPIIVAMNKMDKHEINPDRVKQQLIEHELVPEEWGGDTMIVPVSAKTGMGIDDLLDSVNLVAEMQELKANPDRQARGTIIEAKLDKGKGPVASIIVQTGTLKTGDNILSGTTMGRVRAMFDDKGRAVKSAGPSMAVSILGFEDVPNAGDSIMAVDQALMKQVQEERKNRERESMIKEQSRVTLDDVFAQVEEGKIKNLNLIVKGDVQGSVEAVKQSLEKLSNEEVRVKVIHSGAGAINEGDVMLADSANAIIIGFNVRPDTKAKKIAESSKVDVRSYRIIYELLDDMEAALKGMLAPKLKEVLTGKCEVRQTFNITGVGTIAGCYVIDGKIVRGGKLRIYREDIMICEGGVKQLKRFKDDVKEVNYGYECGCAIDGFNEIRVGDIIECYVTEEIKK